MKVLKTLAVVTISGIMATTAVSAVEADTNNTKCERGAGKHHKEGGKFKKMFRLKSALKAADITSEQKAAIKDLRKSMKETMKAKREEMKASGTRPQFVTVSGVDREGMIAKSVERATFKANMKADMMEKVLAILTAEQKTKFVAALNQPRKK